MSGCKMTKMEELIEDRFLTGDQLRTLLSRGADDCGLVDDINSYFERLCPLMRSITGAGVRQSLDILSELLPIEQLEFATGEQVFDWTVPKEWVVVSSQIRMIWD